MFPDIYQNLPVYLKQHRDDPERRRPVFDENQLLSAGGKRRVTGVVSSTYASYQSLKPVPPHIDLFFQYVAMSPVPDVEMERTRSSQVKQWRQRLPPAWAIHQQVDGQVVPEPGDSAKLTALGRKLVGVDGWTDEVEIDPTFKTR